MITAITVLLPNIKSILNALNTSIAKSWGVILCLFFITLPISKIRAEKMDIDYDEITMGTVKFQPNLPGFGNWYKKRKKPRTARNRNNQPYTKYLEIGGGYSFFQRSQQPKMEPLNNGIALFIGYGRSGKPLSLQLGITTKTAFAQEIFVLKPTVIFGGLRYDTNKLLPGLPEWLNPYVVAGLTFTRAVLTDRVYPGIVNYEFKEESDQNLGGYAGLGLSLRYKNIHFGPQFTVFASGIGQYLAGTFVKQDINIGQLAASFRIAYRFNLRSNKVVCPSYL